MCVVCDAKSNLMSVCEELKGAGQPDLALKFEAFIEIVSGRIYDQENRELNSRMKAKMFDLASSFARGYLPILRPDFLAKIDRFNLPKDSSIQLRKAMRRAMIDLFDVYGNRLPWALYGGYMFMVTRPNVHVAERLPELKSLLPDDLPWECVDAVWHGFPPATALYMHILAVINRHTGTVPLHGCGCNHYLPPIQKPGAAQMLVIYPRPTDIIEETEVPLSHCLNAIETLVWETFVLYGETTKSLRHHVSSAPPIAERVEERAPA